MLKLNIHTILLQPHLRPVTFEEWHCKMCNELCRSLLYYNTGKRCYFDLSNMNDV